MMNYRDPVRVISRALDADKELDDCEIGFQVFTEGDMKVVRGTISGQPWAVQWPTSIAVDFIAEFIRGRLHKMKTEAEEKSRAAKN